MITRPIWRWFTGTCHHVCTPFQDLDLLGKISTSRRGALRITTSTRRLQTSANISITHADECFLAKVVPRLRDLAEFVILLAVNVAEESDQMSA